jgi:hypothetical protein
LGLDLGGFERFSEVRKIFGHKPEL